MKTANRYKISIVTPTYNRGGLLTNAYKSLLNQTKMNFEWIIIDDGSNDNTRDIVSSFLSNDKFKIVYEYQSNGGKHRAINKALDYVSGDYILILDSDDYLDETAIQKLEEWIETIDDNSEFAGVSGNKAYFNGDIIGQRLKENIYYKDCTNIERKKFNLLGDKAEVYRTSIIKTYKFPTFENENFITEEILWDKIASMGYKIRWFNEVIYFCEYLDDGLTKSGDDKFINNFYGYASNVKQKIKLYGFVTKLKYLSNYTRIRKIKKLSHRDAIKIVDAPKGLYYLSLLFEFLKTIYRGRR